MIDISVFAVFHREQAYAAPALRSMRLLVERARGVGLRVQAGALLDRADATTAHIVEAAGAWLDLIDHVDCGDLGLTRNHGVRRADGEYLSFLDGDDLWGSHWLALAHACAIAEGPDQRSIWHPESLLYFDETDFDRHSTNAMPHPSARSFYFSHMASDNPEFDRNSLFLNNVWSANVFAHRDIHRRFPYLHVDRERGFGVEDWTWHMQTLSADVAHRVVAETIHMIRVKQSGSLGQSNSSEGLLPYLPPGVRPTLGAAHDDDRAGDEP